MWQRRKPVAKEGIVSAIALVQALQAELEDRTNARCLAARTGDQYEFHGYHPPSLVGLLMRSNSYGLLPCCRYHHR